MNAPDTHIDTLRARVPADAAQAARLRLSAQLGGANLHPPGLAPAQVLLVRTLSDPDPGRLDSAAGGAMIDPSWERAVRDALGDCLHRAVRPTKGRVPPAAEAVLFRDRAEAWACWSRLQIERPRAASVPWWVRSLEASTDLPASSPGRSPNLATAWRGHARRVPAIVRLLADWQAVAEVSSRLTEAEAEAVLRAVCPHFDVPIPSAAEGPAEEQVSALQAPSRDGDERRQHTPQPPRTFGATPAEATGDTPPWARVVRRATGARWADALAGQAPAHRELLGVALTLIDSPATARSGSFRSAWRAWRRRARGPNDGRGRRDASGRALLDRRGEEVVAPEHRGPTVDPTADHSASGTGATIEEDRPSRDGAASGDQRRAGERRPTDSGPSWDAYATTELGGVLYLVNVLDALDLPSAATVPPIGEHVGAWAVLEVLGRALLGATDEHLCPDDPLWRVLATLDGRSVDSPPGRALDETTEAPVAFRLPPSWMEAPHIDSPVQGRWTVTDGRVLVWTGLGCVADLSAADDPATQAREAWARYPNTGRLLRAESAGSMPLAPAPEHCGSALARWAARVAPFVRSRIAAALGVEEGHTGGPADLVREAGNVYTTDTHVDLVLPLGAARLDVRAAGLDRSPGWWAAGGRVVRFHFRESDV